MIAGGYALDMPNPTASTSGASLYIVAGKPAIRFLS